MANSPKYKAGLIGSPVSHSLSPRLHGFWIKQYGIDGEYNAIEVAKEGLSALIRQLIEEGWRGFNITLPHKESILWHLDDVDRSVLQMGAANLVVINDGRLRGSNTDAYGFWENIQPMVEGTTKAVVLGAGGAARAVVEALIAVGFTQIIVTNRHKERAIALCEGKKGTVVEPWELRSQLLKGVDLLVNATSLGMVGKDALEMDLHLLPTSALVTDIVYTPLQTPLLQQASSRGNRTVDGLGMLLYQAVPAFEAWFGVRPEVTKELREHVLAGAKAA